MKALIICSGGIDSVALAAMMNRDHILTLMTFDYGQKGLREVNVVKELSMILQTGFQMIDISSLSDIFGHTQLTSGKVPVEDEYTPSVIVPLRNAIFLQFAMVYAYSHGIDKVMLGSHMDDIAEVNGERLYPDCSPEFFKAFELAMDLGTFRREKTVRVVSASILGLYKSTLVREGYELLGDFIFKTWSCYSSGEKHCGVCEACRNRRRAFRAVGIEDKTEYEK